MDLCVLGPSGMGTVGTVEVEAGLCSNCLVQPRDSGAQWGQPRRGNPLTLAHQACAQLPRVESRAYGFVGLGCSFYEASVRGRGAAEEECVCVREREREKGRERTVRLRAYAMEQGPQAIRTCAHPGEGSRSMGLFPMLGCCVLQYQEVLRPLLYWPSPVLFNGLPQPHTHLIPTLFHLQSQCG